MPCIADGRATRIGLVGWYGYGNVGDDLILRVLRAALAPTAVFSTRAGEADGTAVLHVDALPAASTELDLVIVGGGGLLNDRWIAKLDLAQVACPYAFLAVGIPHVKWLTGMEKVVAGARFVTLRDHLALETFLTAYPGVQAFWLPDPTFVLAKRRVRRRMTIVLIPRVIPRAWLRDDDPEDSEQRQIACMQSIVDRFSHRADVVALGFEESDRPVLARLTCPGHIVGVDAAIDAIARASAVVTSRLHGGIIAATQGTPAALIDYQDKIRGLACLTGQECHRFDDLGRIPDFVEAALNGAAPPNVATARAYGQLTGRVLGFLAR